MGLVRPVQDVGPLSGDSCIMTTLPDEGQRLVLHLKHLCDEHRLVARYYEGRIWFPDEGAEALRALCEYLECRPEVFVQRAMEHGFNFLQQ